MTSNKVNIQQHGKGQMTITLPQAIAKLKGWKKGDVLEYIENRSGDVILRKLE
jgi:bifunctional DNA-binding transcriptional regulator/antitoxin component of YhaV-PrlF toxin-antitoxin module